MLQLKPGKKLTTLYIGNHLVNARYNYSLIQERIFNYVIFHCRDHINKVKNGTPIYQLDLFGDNTNDIKIKIPLKHIAPPDEYHHVRESMQKMCSIVVQTEVKDKEGRRWKQWQGLFSKVNVPEDCVRSAYMIASMDLSVAEMIVSINHKPDGSPMTFTSFMYEVAMNTKNKYTPRLYKLISSFKKAGGFYYSIDQLRDLLQLGDRYKDVEALRRRILKPVQDELMENADCWFNISGANFEQKDGRRVVGFNFKVISDKLNVNYRTQLDGLIYTLKSLYRFDNDQVDQVRYIIEDSDNWRELMLCLDRVNDRLKTDKTIRNQAAYVHRSIVNHFKEG